MMAYCMLVSSYNLSLATSATSVTDGSLSIRYSALSINRGNFSLYNSRKTSVRAKYEVSFVSANLTEVLSL